MPHFVARSPTSVVPEKPEPPGSLLVTIMIPTYRQAHFLRDAIDSALSQDYRHLEVLVVDDASPDDTPRIANLYQSDSRFRYVRNSTNLGRVATYHKALYVHATGALVLNLDGDDWLKDVSYISDAVRLFQSHPGVNLVFANKCVFNSETGQYISYEENRGLPMISHGTDILLGRAHGSIEIPHLTALYKRDVAMSLGFYSHDVHASDSVSLHLLLPGSLVGFIDREVACWRKHDSNSSSLATVHEMLADFAAADVPAASMASRGLMPAKAAWRWRRTMSLTIGYRKVARLILQRRYGDAMYFLHRMVLSRPLAALSVIRVLLIEGVRRGLGTHKSDQARSQFQDD